MATGVYHQYYIRIAQTLGIGQINVPPTFHPIWYVYVVLS